MDVLMKEKMKSKLSLGSTSLTNKGLSTKMESTLLKPTTRTSLLSTLPKPVKFQPKPEPTLQPQPTLVTKRKLEESILSQKKPKSSYIENPLLKSNTAGGLNLRPVTAGLLDDRSRHTYTPGSAAGGLNLRPVTAGLLDDRSRHTYTPGSATINTSLRPISTSGTMLSSHLFESKLLSGSVHQSSVQTTSRLSSKTTQLDLKTPVFGVTTMKIDSSLSTMPGLSMHTADKTSHAGGLPTKREKGMKKVKIVKAKKGKRDVSDRKMVKYDEYDIPDYTFERYQGKSVVELPKFAVQDNENMIMKLTAQLHDVNTYKRILINAVSSSLIATPDWSKTDDPTRGRIIELADSVANYEPEFILKVALYTRNELNIRTTANFLLSYAANNKICRAFLKKYFKVSIRLPSDWIDVAEQYTVFHDRNLSYGSLPSALRKVMIAKFPDFDKYQLAKYNKEKSKKKKGKDTGGAGRGRGGRGRGMRGMRGGRGRGGFRGGFGRGGVTPGTGPEIDTESSSDSDSEDENEKIRANIDRQISGVSLDPTSETEEELKKKSFTLKQLIRKLHITEPVEHVMCLIGKRYPETLEDFYKCRLPDTFEEERAGKRMKLPTPETWETQVSLKGNKSTTWEDLIDHKKLPFMAMLRNLRNMIKAGISEKHHQWVLKKLTDVGAVTNSRQFPFRFFSAYEVLDQLEKDFNTNQARLVSAAVEATSEPVGRGRGGGRGRGRGGRAGRGGRGGKTRPLKEDQYDPTILNRYKKALDKSVMIATVHNVKPIRGRTIILCNLSSATDVPCQSARGLGKPRTVCEIAVLMGLMCKYSCEESDLIVYGSTGYRSVQLETGTILHNMSRVLVLKDAINTDDDNTEGKLPMDIFNTLLVERAEIDNLMILSSSATDNENDLTFVSDYLKKYRRFVNPNLLFVKVDLAVPRAGMDNSSQPGHDNDIYLSGYSDQILRFIAERGDSGQLTHVDNIDKAYDLTKIPTLSMETPADTHKHVDVDPEKPLALTLMKPSWRTARVFISSTFRDMHGERDLLTRFVFPELRARGEQHFINVFEVDLRWGVTEEQTRKSQTLELCLSEVQKCQFFVGILGERYGWTPDKYDVPDTPEYEWVRNYPNGRSVTELEIQCAALADPGNASGKAFFYFRSTDFHRDIPKEFKEDFECEGVSVQKMNQLKDNIRHSGLEVYDNYPCHWGGISTGKPVVSGLDKFGARVLNNLWSGITNYYPDEDCLLDEISHKSSLHEACQSSYKERFVGRANLVKQCMVSLKDTKSGYIVLSGKPGTGKSALMGSLVHEYLESPSCASGHCVLVHFMGAAPGSTNVVDIMRRLCHEISRRFNLNAFVPDEYKNLKEKLGELLKEAGTMCSTPFTLFIDGADKLDNTNQAHTMQWLPEELSKNVIVVISCKTDTEVCRSLLRYRPKQIIVNPLDLLDKANVVRKTLQQYNKTLDESPFNNQMKLLTAKREANIPLFLTLACEELRVFGVFEKITPKLKSIPHTIPQLIQEVLNRQEEDCGKEVVAMALSLLAASRNGIVENQLHELLSYSQILGGTNLKLQDIGNIDMKPANMIPLATFAQLMRGIERLLRAQTADNVLMLSHQDIETAVRTRYMKGSTREMDAHSLLAGYYMNKADIDKSKQWKGKDIRAFSELPYHLSCCGSYSVLEESLCSLHFIYAKCQLGLASQLLDDFQAQGSVGKTSPTVTKAKSQFDKSERVKAYQAFVSTNLHVFTSYPVLVWQQAMNAPSDTYPSTDVQHIQSEQLIEADLTLVEWLNKPEGVSPCVYTITSISEPVTSVAVSQDGHYMVCGGKDCVVRMYNLNTAKEMKTFTGHSSEITDVCFVGKDRLCTASADETLSLWNIGTGHRLAIMKGHGRRVNSCTSNGHDIVSGGWDCKLIVWNGSDGKKKTDIYGEPGPINCVSFHPEGQLIVTGSWDMAIRIWDIFHKQRKAVLRGHTSSVRAVAYSPDGRHIASASLCGEVKLWSATAGVQVGSIEGHSMPIAKLTYTPSGLELITVSDDQKIKIWSGHLGTPLGIVGDAADDNKDDNEACTAVSLDPTHSGYMVVGYHGGNIRLYDTVTGNYEVDARVHNACVRSIQYTPCGRHIVSASDDTTVKVIEIEKGKVKTCTLSGHTKPVITVTCGSRYIVSGSEDCCAAVFRRPSSVVRGKTLQPMCMLTGHVGPVAGCALDQDDVRIATGSRDGSVRIWQTMDIEMGEMEPTLVLNACHSDWINSITWFTGADYLVTGSNDFTLKVWDIKKKTEKYHLKGHMSAINSVVYSHGCIVSCSSEGTVKVWSQKGIDITTLHGHTQRVNACDILVQVKEKQDEAPELDSWEAMDADERYKDEHEKAKREKDRPQVEAVIVASASDDGTVRMWHPVLANEEACLTGHSDRVGAVACSPSGQIITSSLDCSVKVWNKPSEPLQGSQHSGAVTAMGVNPDRKFLVSGSRDGHIKLWNVYDDTQDTPTCAYTFKGHKNSVTGICYITNDTFVTCSEDASLKSWTIVQARRGFVFQKGKQSSGEGPFSGMIGPLPSDKNIITTNWQGKVQCWNPNLTKQKNNHIKEDRFGRDWILSCGLQNTQNGYTMIHTSADRFTLTQLNNKQSQTPAIYKVPFKYPAEVPQPKWQPNYVTCVSVDNEGDAHEQVTVHTGGKRLKIKQTQNIVAGDVHGQITVLTASKRLLIKQAHSGSVTSVLATQGMIFTAGQDKCIKIWEVADDFKQVGQFFAQSPVTTMTSYQGNTVVTGDKLGNLSFLKLRCT